MLGESWDPAKDTETEESTPSTRPGTPSQHGRCGPLRGAEAKAQRERALCLETHRQAVAAVGPGAQPSPDTPEPGYWSLSPHHHGGQHDLWGLNDMPHRSTWHGTGTRQSSSLSPLGWGLFYHQPAGGHPRASPLPCRTLDAPRIAGSARLAEGPLQWSANPQHSRVHSVALGPTAQ